MKLNTQAFIWTILIWTTIIFIGMFIIVGQALDPYQTPYTDADTIRFIAFVTSPFLITWLIGTATIYIVGYIKK